MVKNLLRKNHFILLTLTLFISLLLVNGIFAKDDWKRKLGTRLKSKFEKNQNIFSISSHLNEPKDVRVIVWGRLDSLENYGEIVHKFSIIPATAMKVPFSRIEELAKTSSVSRINLDKKVHLFREESVPMIRADTARTNYNLNGTEVNISIVDTGIYNHSEFQSPNRLLSKQKCYCSLDNGCCPNGSSVDDNATDDDGHGTHCAGIAAGKGGPYGNGVARDANLLAVKVLNSGGSGYEGDITKGIEWAMDNGANIISLSLGTNYSLFSNCYDVATSEAVDNATKQGVLVVVAAGNSGGGGDETIAAPACAKRALTVGSVNDTGISGSDKFSPFSSRGSTFDNRTKPDLMAPGMWITSTWNSTHYAAISGTSQAAPHVAGVAALLYEEFNKTYGHFPNPDLAKTILMTGVNTTGMRKDGYKQRNNWYGSGRIDAKKVIEIMNYTKNNTISSGITHQYKLNTTSQNFTTTLYWPEDKDTNNNLDLIVGNSTHNFTSHTDANDSVEQRFIYNLSTGIWDVYVKGVDVSSTQKYYLVSDQFLSEDSTPPNLILSKPENKTYSSKTFLSLNFTTDPTNETLWYTLNGENKTIVTDNTTFNLSSDGTYYLTLSVNDSYNNINSSTVFFTVDTTPPSLNIISPNSKNYSTTEIWFNLSLNEKGNLTLFSIDNGKNNSLTGLNKTYFYSLSSISEGNHNVTFYANDSVGYSNSSSLNFTGSIPPIVNSTDIDKPLISPNETVNITVNITESNFSLVWVNITTPFGSITRNMTNSTPSQFKWWLEYNDTNVTGIYNLTLFVNDTLGNKVNSSLSFEVSTPVNFSSNSTDEKGNTINITWKFYYRNMGKIYRQTQTNSTNLTIPSGLWDLGISQNNFSVFIEDLELSSNFNKNLKLNENTSLKNLTNHTFIFHKISVLDWNISFNQLNLTIPFSLTSITNNRNLFKCSNWNLSKCDSSWANITSNSTFSLNYVSVYTSNLSAFSIVETCSPGCGSWGSCSGGTKTRECTRLNCSTYTQSKTCEGDGTTGGFISGATVTEEEVECTSNLNCSSNQICSDGECVNLTCESCSYIEDHQCISYECCSDQDCPSNESCENNECIFKFNLSSKLRVKRMIESLEKRLENKTRQGFNTTSQLELLGRVKENYKKGNYTKAETLALQLSDQLKNLKLKNLSKPLIENKYLFWNLILIISLLTMGLIIFKYE